MKHWILKFLIGLGKCILTWVILAEVYFFGTLILGELFLEKGGLIVIVMFFALGYLLHKKENRVRFLKKSFSYVVYALLFNLAFMTLILPILLEDRNDAWNEDMQKIRELNSRWPN